jgi:hypothetical protein
MESSHPASDSCTYTIHWSNGSQLTRDGLQALAAKVLLAVETLAKDYIWQREGFNLRVASDGVSLTGSVRLGESVQDEWYIVWLLVKISSEFPEAVIEVKDNDDGQFLLIEAAEVLPKWLNPGNAENRVCLAVYCGGYYVRMAANSLLCRSSGLAKDSSIWYPLNTPRPSRQLCKATRTSMKQATCRKKML